MLKSPSGTSFGLYFVYKEYRAMTQTDQRTGTVPLRCSRGLLKSMSEQFFPRIFSSKWSSRQRTSPAYQ